MWPRTGCLVARRVELKNKGLGPTIGVSISCRGLSQTFLTPSPHVGQGAGHRQALGPFHRESPAALVKRLLNCRETLAGTTMSNSAASLGLV